MNSNQSVKVTTQKNTQCFFGMIDAFESKWIIHNEQNKTKKEPNISHAFLN